MNLIVSILSIRKRSFIHRKLKSSHDQERLLKGERDG